MSEDMDRYVILGDTEEGSFTLCLKDSHEAVRSPTARVIKEFDAVCRCAAQQEYCRFLDHGEYDMLFCEETPASERCAHFEELRRKL